MTQEDRSQELTSILEAVEHSAPSVSKYRGLQLLLSKCIDLEPQLVYPTYASKAGNISVRSGQSKRAKSARLMVFVVSRTDQEDSIKDAARTFARQERKPVLILQRDPSVPSWRPTYGLVPVGDQLASDVMRRLRDAFGPFEVSRHPQGHTRSAVSTFPTERREPIPFVVLPDREAAFKTIGEALVLVPDYWDDFGFKTLFDLYYANNLGKWERIGRVKIAHTGQDRERTSLPERFTALDSGYFSVGQDDAYYEWLKTHGFRELALTGLRDIAYDEEVFDAVADFQITTESLLRGIPRSTVETQFRRIAHGGVKLRDFIFQYTALHSPSNNSSPLELTFEVLADSEPSTNIHVIIGSNGVGKTTLLRGMCASLKPTDGVGSKGKGSFIDLEADREHRQDLFPFLNVILVSFSAFDSFLPAMDSNATNPDALFSPEGARVPISYIGLGNPESDDGRRGSLESLAEDFVTSVDSCLQNEAQRKKWVRAMESLEVDPLFRDLDVRSAVGLYDEEDEDLSWDSHLMDAFRRASSGHRVVLLTLTRLVEETRERSLILFDEPESHLHPPLLSAYMRALSDLLAEANGAAIIASHSPVVLQDVPRNCVWKLRRSGSQSVSERPQIETFGENIGVLTHEVFGLEATQSGYHAELQRAVDMEDSFEAVASRFGDQLGSEAQGVVRIMLAVKAARSTR